ncbi:MYND-type domain-containing protein [Mycena venus]|uniref:MYND-type domain-containing protein n=1 Tax=Mycena venus TaxID=2733690 RepID=A0A8H6Y9M9_9AGAR|nr:MYND-type domain-containing protein [Mycena venus]
MHPALGFDALSRLPLAYKKVATSAARGDYKDLQRLATFIQRSSETHAISTLPAFYANLDPSSIPSGAQLETSLSGPLRASIGRAIIALQNLQILLCLRSFPPDASLELWPRVWAWLDFLHLYKHCIDGADTLIDVKTYIIWASLLMNLQDYTLTGLIAHHPGVQAVVTRAWILTVDVPDRDRDEVFAKAQFMLLLDPKNPVSLAEILEEAGGTFDHLAALVVRHLKQVIPRRTETVSFWSAVITFLDDMEYKSVPFKDALLANGAVSVLVKTILSSTNMAIPPTMLPHLRRSLLTILQRLLHHPPGYTAMSEALDAGLLRVIATCGVDPEAKDLLNVVSPSMVYYSVISRMEQSIRDVETLSANMSFRNSTIYPAWREFRTLCEQRLSTLKYFHSKPRASLKACDNLDCEAPIGPKSQFKRCSLCQTAHYCSSACQTLDWKHGGHRDICQNLRSVRFREPSLSSRERGFFRVLLYEQYQKSRPELLRQQSSVSRSRPGIELYTSFDYTASHGDATVKLGSVLDAQRRTPTRDWAALWNYYATRMKRCQGTLELHLLKVMEGQQLRMRLFPVRTVGGQSA